MKKLAVVLVVLAALLAGTWLADDRTFTNYVSDRLDVLSEKQDDGTDPTGPNRISQATVMETYGRLPLNFAATSGLNTETAFLSQGNGYNFLLTPTEAVLSLERPRSKSNPRSTVFRTKFVGADPAAKMIGIEELPGRNNYFIGNDADKWRTDVPTFGKVKYEKIYPGIDLVYYGNQRQLEYDLLVAPGADPSAIKLSITGAGKGTIDQNGDLLLRKNGDTVSWLKPIVYQESASGRVEVPASYSLRSGGIVAFELGAYDHSLPLVIDPILAYSTFLGGSGDENVFLSNIAIDGSGSAYVTGYTNSANFPVAGAYQPVKSSGNDIFVTKINPSGTSIVYSTYFGGTGEDIRGAIAIDSSGNAYLTGDTTSDNFPVTAGAFQTTKGANVSGFNDAFVTKLNPQGNGLVYSTYLGGNGGELGASIAVDNTGNAYVTGQAFGGTFPTVNAYQATRTTSYMAFVSKLNSTGSSLLYSTFLGGNNDTYGGLSIAADNSGGAYVTGQSSATNFPSSGSFQSHGGGFDAFVTKFNTNASGAASLVYSSNLGGSGTDVGYSITIDASGNAYVSGQTNSTNFPTTAPIQSSNAGGYDAFVTKVNPSGSAKVYSTYIGGSLNDVALAIDVDGSGNAFIAGNTASTNFPTVGPLQIANGGGQDAIVAKVNAAGSALLYSTYLGGSGSDSGNGIVVDTTGNAYVLGSTASTNFPITGAFQSNYGGGGTDAFVTKIVDAASNPTPTPTPTSTPTPTPTRTPTPTPTPTPGAAIYRINSAGPDVAPFSADSFFSGGATFSTTAAINTSGVTNPAPQAVYQTQRFGAFTYTFAGLTPGANYVVRLHFAEIFYTSSGQRTFNVFINGGGVLAGYDVFADAGTANKAVIKEFTGAADASGQIVVAYTPGSNNPISNGIEILNSSGTFATPTPTPTPAVCGLRADYQFNSSLASSAGTAPALTNLGNNTFGPATVDGTSRTTLQFAQQNGLALVPTTGVISNDVYSVVALFSFNDVSGYRRIFDFKNNTSDSGLYNLNGSLVFFGGVNGSGSPISAGAYVQVVLTRDASKNVTGYVNGVQQFTFVDSGDQALIDTNNRLIFFRDDANNEASAGRAARIRLFGCALTAAEVAGLDRLPGPTATPTPTPGGTPIPSPTPSPGGGCRPDAPQVAVLTAFSGGIAIFPDANASTTPEQRFVTGLPGGAGSQGVSFYGTDNALVSDAQFSVASRGIFVIKVSTGALLSTINPGAGYNGSGTIAVAPDASTALSAGGTSTLFVVRAPFNESSGIERVTLPGSVHTGQTQAIVFNSAGRAFVAQSSGISVLDPPYSSVAFNIPLSGGGGPIAVTPDGSTLLFGKESGTDPGIRIINAPFSSASVAQNLAMPAGQAIAGLAVTPDGTKAIATGFPRAVFSISRSVHKQLEYRITAASFIKWAICKFRGCRDQSGRSTRDHNRW
ncbi:MAG: SBBP repeat-containing protein [Pyrinomonadaceae bacterium]